MKGVGAGLVDFKSIFSNGKGYAYFSDPTLTWWHCLYAAYRYRIIVSAYNQASDFASGSFNRQEHEVTDGAKANEEDFQRFSAIKPLAWISKESPMFVKRFAMASFIEMLLYTFAHAWMTSICYGQPISLFATDGPVLLCLLAWFLMFCSPYDLFYRILKNPIFQMLLSFFESSKKTRDFLYGIDASSKLFPHSVFGPMLIAVLQVFAGHLVLFLLYKIHSPVSAISPLRNEFLSPSAFFKTILFLGLFSALTNTPHGRSILALSKGADSSFKFFRTVAYKASGLARIQAQVVVFLEKWSKTIVWFGIAYFYLSNHLEKLMRLLMSKGGKSKSVKNTEEKDIIESSEKQVEKKSSLGFLSSKFLKKTRDSN